MATPLAQVTIPAKDSLRVRYSVRLEDRTLLHLTGFTVTMVVKASNIQSAPVVVQSTGAVQSPDTTAIVSVVMDVLNPGTYYATIRAFNGTESYSTTIAVLVTDHA